MQDKTLAAMEAILFSVGHAIGMKELREAVGISEEDFADALERMRHKYNAPRSGLLLLTLEDKIQLCAKPEYFQVLADFVKKPRSYELSETMMETLAIIAYRQPVTRMDIERIRGVRSDYALNSLIEYGLVREAGRMAAPGKPLLFVTTDEFLRHFGFSSIEEMPTFGRDELDAFRFDATKEADDVTDSDFHQEIDT